MVEERAALGTLGDREYVVLAEASNDAVDERLALLELVALDVQLDVAVCDKRRVVDGPGVKVTSRDSVRVSLVMLFVITAAIVLETVTETEGETVWLFEEVTSAEGVALWRDFERSTVALPGEPENVGVWLTLIDAVKVVLGSRLPVTVGVHDMLCVTDVDTPKVSDKESERLDVGDRECSFVDDRDSLVLFVLLNDTLRVNDGVWVRVGGTWTDGVAVWVASNVGVAEGVGISVGVALGSADVLTVTLNE